LTTKLALLLDECVQTHLAEEIGRCPGVSGVERIDDSHELGNCSTPDTRVMAHAVKTGRILVTVESRLNEERFPICTHPGIIVISGSHALQKGALFSRFMRSGERKHAKHAVTYLRASGSIIRMRHEDGSTKDIPLDI
jgi:predicted nuclease of predicted toxin-antitoxin system